MQIARHRFLCWSSLVPLGTTLAGAANKKEFEYLANDAILRAIRGRRLVGGKSLTAAILIGWS